MTTNSSSESTPFPLPNDWRWLPFGAVAKVASNLTKPMDYPSFPHIAPNHIESWTGRLFPFKTVAEDQVISAKHMFRGGQILYSKIRPNLAKAILVDFDGLCSADMYPIETSLNPEYLLAWMLSPWFTEAATRNQGRNLLPKINVKELSSLPVPVPPAKDQKRIAEVVGLAGQLRAKRRRAVSLFDDLTQSIFHDMFGAPSDNSSRWDVISFGEGVEDFRYGTSSKSGSEGLPALRIPNVISGRLDLNEIKLVPVTPAEEMRLQLRDGDLLFVRTNGNPEYVGRCAAFFTQEVRSFCYDPNRYIYASYLIRSRLNVERLHPIYVCGFMQSTLGRKALRERSKTSAGQFNINIDGLGSIPIPYPPMALQVEFAKLSEQATEAHAVRLKHLSELDALFASVQDRAFRNEL